METRIKIESIEAMIKSESCVTAITAVFKAIAFCDTVRSIVEPKQNELINFFKFKVRDEFKERRGIEVITEYKQLYMADESDWEIFENEMVKFYKEQGLKYKEGCCPLLEAESLVREVKRHAIGIFEPFTSISLDMLFGNIKLYEKYIDLLLTIFAPIVKTNLNPKQSWTGQM